MKSLGHAAGFAAMLGITLVAASAGADAKPRKVDQITCEEFLGLNTSDQARIAYWIDGYAQAKNEAEIGAVAFDKLGHPLGSLVEDCKATPKETLWQKIKKHGL